MSDASISSNLVSDLREAETSGRGNGGHRDLCGLAASEIERLQRELWVIAECIFQNVSSDDAKHWARGIKVSLQSGDVAPRVTVETTAAPFPYPCDRVGWICSVCHQWNLPKNKFCSHEPRPATDSPVEPRETSVSTPPPGLLVSMAIRMDRALGIPGYYDQPLFAMSSQPIPHQQQMEAAIITARQMWEEVVGQGFYRPEREAEYAAKRGSAVEPERCIHGAVVCEKCAGMAVRNAEKASECQHDRFKPNPTLTWMGSTPDITKATHRYCCKVCRGLFDLEPGIAQQQQVSGRGRAEDQAAASSPENGSGDA